MRYTDISNKKYNRLTAIKYLYTNKNRIAVWLFKCDCGKEIEKNANTVKMSMTKSCGCLNIEVQKSRVYSIEEAKKRKQNQTNISKDKWLQKPENRIIHNLRVRMYKFLKNERKYGHLKEYIGCNENELKSHIESKFSKGMTWENYGEWHIDHIKPVSSFNLIKEIREINHYQNLQPLWAIDNYKKGNKFILIA